MTQQVSKARWFGVLLLQIPLYLITSYVMRSLLGGSYRLLIKAGATLPPNLLLQHFLFVGLIGGFLAGLLGLLAIRIMLLLPTGTQAPNGPAWRRPQAWAWVISTCWFAFGIFVWSVAHAQRSVLTTSSSIKFADLIAAFFGRGCDLSAPKIDLSVVQTCMNQISYTHPWLGTIGYSAAAFVPVGWTNDLNSSPDSVEELEVATEAQSRPGDVN